MRAITRGAGPQGSYSCRIALQCRTRPRQLLVIYLTSTLPTDAEFMRIHDASSNSSLTSSSPVFTQSFPPHGIRPVFWARAIPIDWRNKLPNSRGAIRPWPTCINCKNPRGHRLLRHCAPFPWRSVLGKHSPVEAEFI